LKNHKSGIRFVEIAILVLFGLTTIVSGGCNCNQPFIKGVEVWIDRDPEHPFSDQIVPSGLTYEIPENTSFRIKIKTQEALSDSDLDSSGVIIRSDPSIEPNLSIPLRVEHLEGLTYKADCSSEKASSLEVGQNYETIIHIHHNGQDLYQTITLKIK